MFGSQTKLTRACRGCGLIGICECLSEMGGNPLCRGRHCRFLPGEESWEVLCKLTVKNFWC